MHPIPIERATNDVLPTKSLSSSSTSSGASSLPLQRSKSSRLRLLSATSTRLSFRSFRQQRHRTADKIPRHKGATARSCRPIVSVHRAKSTNFTRRCGLKSDADNCSFCVTPEDPEGIPYTMRSDENPFETIDDASRGTTSQTECMDHDEISLVSSISNDSARRFSTEALCAADAKVQMPSVIFVRIKSGSSSSCSECSNKADPPVHPLECWHKSWIGQGPGTGTMVPEMDRGNRSQSINSTDRPASPSPMSRSQSQETIQNAEALGSNNNFGSDSPLNRLSCARKRSTSVVLPAHVEVNTSLDVRLLDPRAASSVVNLHLENTSLSIKHHLQSINTDATTSTLNTSPDASPTATLYPSIGRRDAFIFRPVMRRASTTNAGAYVLRKPALAPRHHTCCHIAQPVDAASVASSKLLGDRPRRKPVQGSASVFSFGSIVGQSSLIAPTNFLNGTVSDRHCSSCSFAPTSAKEFGQLVKANKRLDEQAIRDDSEIFIPPISRRRKSGFHQDIESFWKAMRRYTGTEARLDFSRNRTGCLT